jgi:hypothetical protein
MPEDVRAWEHQAGESSRAFEAFACYRDMGSARSLQAVSDRIDKSVSMLKRWSSRRCWQERVEAWDREQERYAAQAAAQAGRERAEEIRQRQLKDGRDLQRLARAGIAQLVQRDPVSGESSLRRELKVQEIVALHRYGAELERLAAPAAAEPHGAASDDETGELDEMLRDLPQKDFADLLEAARRTLRKQSFHGEGGKDSGEEESKDEQPLHVR